MGLFKAFTARRLLEILQEAEKHHGEENAIDMDAPIEVFVQDDSQDDMDEGDFRQVRSIGGDMEQEGLVLTLFDRYGD